MPILDSVYTDKVELEILLPEDDVENLQEALVEATNGQVEIQIGQACYFAQVDGKMELFE